MNGPACVSRLRLEAPLVVGAWRLVALCEQQIAAAAPGAGVTVFGRKRPLAVVLAGPQGVQVVGPDGAPVDARALARRCPELERWL
ncbi:MAG: hypothetical protein KF683_13300 [Rubrivivax sp.]|nr:hypothetical protein [Rubrivivax sp.]